MPMRHISHGSTGQGWVTLCGAPPETNLWTLQGYLQVTEDTEDLYGPWCPKCGERAPLHDLATQDLGED